MQQRFSNTQNITEMIQLLFDTAGDNIEPIKVESERTAAREASALVTKFDSATDWDEQLAAIQRGMSLVKGGACNFAPFVAVIPSIIPAISSGILNMRSTLVKYSCLFVTQLAKAMREKFENGAEALVPVLFQPTTHGTQIIASSCRNSIEAIARNCQTKKIMLVILQNAGSKAQVHRNIVAECLEVIVKEWKPRLIQVQFKAIESVLTSLSQDAGIEARSRSKSALKVLAKRFPGKVPESPAPSTPSPCRKKSQIQTPPAEKTEVLPTQFQVLPSPAKTEEEEHSSVIKLSTSHDINYFSTSLCTLEERFVCSDGEESKFIDSVRMAMVINESSKLQQNAEDVAEGFMKCLQSPDENVLMQALNVIVDVIPVIPSSFDKHLEQLISTLLDKAENIRSVSLNASSVLRILSQQYPAERVLVVGLKSPPSCPLLSFAANVVRQDENVLTMNSIARDLLSICCAVFDTTKEQRFSALAVGLLNKINGLNHSVFEAFCNSIPENWQEILKSLHLIEPEKKSARRPIRVLQKQEESNSPETLLRRLNNDKYKDEPLAEIEMQIQSNAITAPFQPWLEALAHTLHSGYCEEAERCITLLVEHAGIENILDSAVSLLKSEGSSSAADLLTMIIKLSKPRDIAPRIHAISACLANLLVSPTASIRKSAVFSLVEVRLTIGKKFDIELAKLPPISQDVVHHYVSRREQLAM